MRAYGSILSTRDDFKWRTEALISVGLNGMGPACRKHGNRSLPSVLARTSFGNMIGVVERTPLETEALLYQASLSGMSLHIGNLALG